MSPFNLALAAILAPVAFAVPQAGYGGYGHPGHTHHTHNRPSGVPTGGPIPSGSGLSPSGSTSAPYGFGNSTAVGPTGTGTGASSAPQIVTVVPVPVSSTTGDSSGSASGGSGTGNSPTGLSSAGDQCGPATVTVTSANTVTVTVPAASVSSPVSASSIPSAPYPVGNETSVIGSTGIAETVSTGIPTAPGLPTSNGLPSSSISTPVASSTDANSGLSMSAPAPVNSYSSPAAVMPSPYIASPSISAGQFYAQSSSSSSVEAVPASSTSAPGYSATIPSSSSTPTHTSSPSTSGGDVVPRGLVYNAASLTSLFEGPNVGWCYNWDSQPGGDIPSSMNYVPMLWNPSDLHLPRWTDNVNSAIANGATHILGFNEPDLPYQANMSPQEAAGAWDNLEKFGGQVKIGSPAVCNDNRTATIGLNWLKSFMDECSSCQIDFIAIHWYGYVPETDVENLKTHIRDAQAIAGGRPIWLTEFAATQGSDAQKKEFMDTILPWLDDKSNGVERYAYHQVDGALASGSAKTPLGDAYTA